MKTFIKSLCHYNDKTILSSLPLLVAESKDRTDRRKTNDWAKGMAIKVKKRERERKERESERRVMRRVTAGRTKYDGTRRERRLNISEPNPPIGRGSTSRVGIDFQSRGGWSYNGSDARSPRSTPGKLLPAWRRQRGPPFPVSMDQRTYTQPRSLPRVRRGSVTPPFGLYVVRTDCPRRDGEGAGEEWRTGTKRRHNSIDQGSMRASGRNPFVRSVGPERAKKRERENAK